MRMAIAVAFFSAASFLAVGLASAVPLALGDQAALARDASAGAVEPAARRYTHSKRYAGKYSRRYNWTYYPYWRPYQYRYW